MNRCRSLIGALSVAFFATALAGADRFTLNNGELAVEFGRSGLVQIALAKTSTSKKPLAFDRDSALIMIDGRSFGLSGTNATMVRQSKDRVEYQYSEGGRNVRVVYELQPGWRFVSKQIVVDLDRASTCRVERVELLNATVTTPVAREMKASNPSGVVFLRLGDQSAGQGTLGAFVAVQNPFLQWDRHDAEWKAAYEPKMDWRGSYGSFVSDRLCIGLHALTGVELPYRAPAEWKYVPASEDPFAGKPALDRAEFDAATACVDAFRLFRPAKSLRVHVPWCENDYQIDVATPSGRAEWKRILDQCAAVGVDNALFTPANSAVARLEDNADAWGWENCLWLGLGQKIRKGEWDIAKDPIPPSVDEMLQYAKAKHVKLIAYAYPTLPWKQNPEWTAWCQGKTGGYVGVDTGVRSFQDWFVEQLIAFKNRTGIAGYSFDHWWIAYEPTKEGFKPTSKYAQWYGCRRILEELRRRAPDVVIDGRQQYQWFGPWTWLGGSYPHPTTNDEQPGSFENFPDLHFSRVSADRQRWAAWYYHMEQFTPLELVPGYITHQTPRSNEKDQCVKDEAFHTRDWDYLGWRYSVISSIGSAPFNHVVNLLPARSEAEFRSFRPEDQRWLKGWMDWTDARRATLKRLRPIIGPPMLGHLDGSAAILGEKGFVFLFNPNYQKLHAEFKLDRSIGLEAGKEFVLRELYPREGRLFGKTEGGVWTFGDTVSLPIKGPEALVLEVVPCREVKRPAILNALGTAEWSGGRLTLSGVEGEMGSTVRLGVLLPSDRKVTSLSVNGTQISSFTQAGGRATVPVTFAGVAFEHCQAVGAPGSLFAEKTFATALKIPARVFGQLEARRKAWPVPYSNDELLATWRGSDRLLLYIHIADPDDKWTVGLKLNGESIPVRKAYGDVFPLGRERTFTGFYVDVSHLRADTPYDVEVTLPADLKPGQFQGLFFENVETEWTRTLVPSR